MTRKTFRQTLQDNDDPQRERLRWLLWTREQCIAVGDPKGQLAALNVEIAALKEKLGAPKQKRVQREAPILKAILQLLKQHPKIATVARFNSGTIRVGNRWFRANSQRGMSDIMGTMKDGRTIAIEVKAPNGVVAGHQHEFLNSIAVAGGIAFVARSVDDVIERLNKL